MSIAELLQYDWAVRALIASSMVGVLCGSLGCFIVLRNMALIGDALSHAILPGVVFAFMLVGYSALGFFVGSVIAGLVAAGAITWIQQNVQTKNDAAIGIIFTAMFSVGVMSISRLNTSEGVHLDLKDFLFGNILGISDTDLVMTGVVTLVVILSIILFYRYLFISTFQPTIADAMGFSTRLIHYFLMLLLSFAIVASLQTVGVILVVAMLITPPSTAILWSNKLQHVIIISACVGLLSALTGFLAAVYFETTPGPAMAIAAALMYALSVLAAPEKGIVSRKIQKDKLSGRIHREDILKQVYRHGTDHSILLKELRDKLQLGSFRIKRLLSQLAKTGLLAMEGNGIITLTLSGHKKAEALVRAHRLWESYLVSEIGLTEEQIHEEAEEFEHLLTEDLLDEVDQELGFPVKDPHGSPIPQKMERPELSLLDLQAGSTGKISEQQHSGEIVRYLWECKLSPGTKLEILQATSGEVTVGISGATINIPVSKARQIRVQSD